MNAVLTIARRELASYFQQPAGWIIVALFAFLTGVVFALLTLIPGQPATMRAFFNVSGWLLLPVVPAVTMRMISEEIRSGTLEALLTAPVRPASVVLGKYAAGLAFLGLMLVPSLAFVATLVVFASPGPDYGSIVAGYVCLVLLGGLFMSLGVLASSLTSNATLAFMAAMVGILGLLSVPQFAGGRLVVGTPVQKLFLAFDLSDRIGDFARGVVDLSHVVFFVSVAAWFLVAAVSVQEVRRWR